MGRPLTEGGALGVRCPDHPAAPSLVACSLCGRALCDACFEFTSGPSEAERRALCLRCAYEVGTRGQRSITLPVSFVGLGGSVLLFVLRRGVIGVTEAVLIAILLAAGGGLIFWFFHRESRDVARRDRDVDAPPEVAPAHPYRQRVRHVTMRLAPRVSGKLTALAVGVPLLITAVLFPTVLNLPRWAELEVVLSAWWMIFSAALAVLLFRGYRLRDDFLFIPPWRRSFTSPDGKSTSDRSCGSLSGCDGCGSAPDAEGIVFLIALVVAVLVLFGAAWVVAEIAMPVVMFLGYATITRALTQVAHDTHGCEGSVARSLGWGALWGAIYTAPLAAFVYLVFRTLG